MGCWSGYAGPGSRTSPSWAGPGASSRCAICGNTGWPWITRAAAIDYDIVITCSDVVMPRNIRDKKVVVVQEGMTDPERFWFWARKILPIVPRWAAGTAWTGASNLYDRFCVASPGYRDLFVRKGADPEKIVVTGIPNFDDCARYRDNSFPHRDYVLCCTSDTRETLKLDNRKRFIRRAREIAGAAAPLLQAAPQRELGAQHPRDRALGSRSARLHARVGRGDGRQRKRRHLSVFHAGLRGAGPRKRGAQLFRPATSSGASCPCRAAGRPATSRRSVARSCSSSPHSGPAAVPARARRPGGGGALMRIVAVVQARMGSSRLPGKVARPVLGATLLERMLERVAAARTLDEVVVATTRRPEDEAIVQICRPLRVPVYAGHPTDLLDRHLQAARAIGAEVLVKIPSDCPLIDPRIIDRVVGFYRDHADRFDFVSNLHPASYPDGNDVEVVPLAVLEEADRHARKPHEREHTTPFVWDQPERFRIGNVVWESGLDYSMSHRFTVDYPEDLAFVQAVFEELYQPAEAPFTLESILSLLQTRPDIFELNRQLAGVNWYRHHLAELRTVGRHETQPPGNR